MSECLGCGGTGLGRDRAGECESCAGTGLDLDEQIQIPLDLFRNLIFLQAAYAWQLNGRDGGDRRPVVLPRSLVERLTPRERDARERADNDGGAGLT